MFEVDQPGVQAMKLQQLADADIECGPMVTHVPVDFESMELWTALSGAGCEMLIHDIMRYLGELGDPPALKAAA